MNTPSNSEKKEIAALRNYLQTKISQSLFSGLSLEQDYDYINNLRIKYPNNPSALIAKGYLDWRFGNKTEGIALFEKAYQIAQQSNYILRGREIGINTFLGNTYSDETIMQSLPLSLDIAHVRKAANKPYTIIAACDEVYFQRFGKGFLEGCLKHSNAIVHIHVINPSDQTVDFFKNQQGNRISFSLENTKITHRAYYASSRFLIASTILKTYDTNLLIVDIDSIVTRNLDRLHRLFAEKDEDIFVPTMHNAWNPWNFHLATAVYLKANHQAEKFFNYFSRYNHLAAQRLGSYKEAWWIDQNSLYGAIKFIEKNRSQVGNITQYGRVTYGPIVGKDNFSKLIEIYNTNVDDFGKNKLVNEDEFLSTLKLLLKHNGLALLFLESFYNKAR